jgi:LysR family transcriptional regulator of abg operon
MKLEQLQHLVAIVEHGSLRSASRRLQIPQPALTRSVRALEKELGGAVFLRATTGMELTALGRRFHVRASTIIHEARRALDEIAQHSGEDHGSVVVALSIMPHVGMLPYALKAFRQRYPKVRMQLIEGLFPDAESGLRDGAIDFYLGAAPHNAPAPGLAMQKLFDNTRAVVCRKGHPLSGCSSFTELAGADWATTAVDYDAAEDLVQLFAKHGMPSPQVVLQARSAMSVMVALAHSDLLALLPVQWGEFPLTRDTLQTIRLGEVLPAPAIVLVRRPDLPLTPAAEFLCDVLMRHGPATADL